MFTRLARWISSPRLTIFAKMGDRRNRSLKSIGPVLEYLESRELFSLSPVAPNAGAPYGAIAEILATFPDGRSYVGTGTMVDSFHTLTAGHLVYSYADGGYATYIRVTPELSGISKPFGVAYATAERTFPTFITYNQTHPGFTAPGDMDIGLITLDRNIGNLSGWVAYSYDNNDADFAAGTVYDTAGYPATNGYNGHYMESSEGPVTGLSSDGSAIWFTQNITTPGLCIFGGDSGSALWRSDTTSTGTTTPVTYGVVVGGGGPQGNLDLAMRITQPIYTTLKSWQASDAVPALSQSVSGSRPTGTSPVTMIMGPDSIIEPVNPWSRHHGRRVMPQLQHKRPG